MSLEAEASYLEKETFQPQNWLFLFAQVQTMSYDECFHIQMIWVEYFVVKYSCNNNILQKTNILGDILMSLVYYCGDI